MDIEYPGFGTIVVDGTRYDHDVVIEEGRVRPRDKGPSRAHKAGLGHTPLTADEAIPWTKPRLIIGSGYSGRLPILPDVAETAAVKGVDLEIMPTGDACALIRTAEADAVNAILHVTC